MSKKRYKSKYNLIISIITLIMVILIGYYENNYEIENNTIQNDTQIAINNEVSFNLNEIPDFDGKTPYVILNNNEPEFPDEDFNINSFEKYSELDSLGRCGVAYANVSKDTMPTEARGDISKVKPTGWHAVRYDCVDGKYLYNRCHLIGYQLTAENENKQNLITGTRYLNVEGMLPFENQVAEYIKTTNGHVLYRVTPIFKDNNLVANGVQMEAISVEDRGEQVQFNIYAYNVQPNIKINYLTGSSELIE